MVLRVIDVQPTFTTAPICEKPSGFEVTEVDESSGETLELLQLYRHSNMNKKNVEAKPREIK